MTITVFAKTSHNNEGKTFISYSGRMTNKSGEVISMGIKFKQPCNGPTKDQCPVNINFKREDANLQERYDDKTDRVYKTLWVSAYEIGDAYVDHSLDDFD